MPFPIQSIQPNRGWEFIACKVQECLFDQGIKLCPMRPGVTHLNGKVERSQRTDRDKFYAVADLDSPELSPSTRRMAAALQRGRPSRLPARTFFHPLLLELNDKTPLQEDADALFVRSKERFRDPNTQIDP